MLDSHIHHIHDSVSTSSSASIENAGLGLWILAKSHSSNQEAIDLAVRHIERAVERGDSLIKSIEAAHNYLAEHYVDDQVQQISVIACMFDSFHYELSWVGDACAFLFEKDSDSSIVLSPRQDSTPVFYLGGQVTGRIPRVLGDMHAGEVLLLSAEPFGEHMSDTISAHLLSSEVLTGLRSERLARNIQSQCATSCASFAILRYEEEQQSIRKSDFDKRRARAHGNSTSTKKSMPSLSVMALLALLSVLLITLTFVLFA